MGLLKGTGCSLHQALLKNSEFLHRLIVAVLKAPLHKSLSCTERQFTHIR